MGFQVAMLGEPHEFKSRRLTKPKDSLRLQSRAVQEDAAAVAVGFLIVCMPCSTTLSTLRPVSLQEREERFSLHSSDTLSQSSLIYNDVFVGQGAARLWL